VTSAAPAAARAAETTRSGSRPAGVSRPATGPSPQRRYRRRFAELTPVGQQIARAWAVRPAKDEFLCPQLDDLVLPAGYRPVVDLDEAAAVLAELPDGDLAYDNSRRTRAAIGRALADFLHTDSGLIVVGHETLGEHAARYNDGRPIPRSTVGYHLRAVEDAGTLYVAFRGRSRQVAGRDLANVYVILAPADTLTAAEQAAVDQLAAQLEDADEPTPVTSVDEFRHLPFREAQRSLKEGSQARIAGNFPSSKACTDETVSPGTSSGCPRTIREGEGRLLPRMPLRRERVEHFAPRNTAEQRMAVAWLLHLHGWRYDQHAEEQLRIVCALFFRHGWSPRALARAFEVRPDGGQHPGPLPLPHNRDRARPSEVRNLWAVLTVRLRSWRDPMGTPMTAPIPAETPRRGRPTGAMTQRRMLIEQVERLASTDPRRVAALAALRGEKPQPVQPRGAAAAAAVEQVAAQLAAEAAQRRLAEEHRERLRAEFAQIPGVLPSAVDPEPNGEATADRSAMIGQRAILRARTERRNGQ